MHGFAAQSGGLLQIASALGEGTKVDLWLPCTAAEPIKTAGTEPNRSLMGWKQARILVCDDDPDVLGFVGTVLRDDGCEVFETGTPTEALKAIETEPAFDLLLVDYAMPEMSGVTVIERARACQQELKVLLMSGHADVLRAGGKLTIPLLAKPFKLAELRKRIGEILLLPSAEFVTGHSVSHHFAVSD